jgi:hypothetical protein
MAKYGEENFTIDVIDTASDYDELKEKEKILDKILQLNGSKCWL